MKKILTVFIFSQVFSAVALTADIYIRTKTLTGAFMGQPAKEEISECWLGNNLLARHMTTTSYVVDLNKKYMVVIYHPEKSYVELTLPLDISKQIPVEVEEMIRSIKSSAAVTPTGESKKINTWNCKGYDIAMKMMMTDIKQKWWTTTDVPFDWKKYSKYMYQTIFPTMPTGDNIFTNLRELDEFKKIEGFQVEAEITMSVMGREVSMTSKVLEISKKPAPAGIYSFPHGYNKQEKLTMKGSRD